MLQVVSRGGSRWLLLVLLIVAGFVGLALDGGWSWAEDAGGSGSPPERPKLDRVLDGAVPVASLSTETSRTYRRPDGTFVTRVFAQDKDADGSLKPVAAGFAAEGDDARTVFPSSLSDPVKVTRGEAWVSLQLRGAGGTGEADGSTITYTDALPGVAVKYRASHGAVGEELRLTGAGAPSSYVFDLDASAGVEAQTQHNGTIALTDADGHRVFSLSPSYAYAERDRDATKRVTTTLAVVDGGWRVTLAVDEAWLRDELARGPVTIDPTVELQGATKDCALTSDTPDLSFCADDQLWIGWSGDHDHHALIKWDLSGIPKDAAVLWGDVGLYQPGAYGIPVSKQLTLHRVTRDWTNGASWNTYDGTHAWTTPGGDFDSTPAATTTVPANHGGWTDWSATTLAQHWLDGSLPNYGVAIQDKAGPHITGEEDYYSTEGTIPAQAPELDIVWTTRTGNPDFYTFESQGLDGKTTAGVNAANGNLLLSTKDIDAPGSGLNLRLDHYHNSLADPAELSALGIRGTASLGRDVHLHAYDDQTIAFSRGDGLTLPFTGATTTGATITYGAPAELADATLIKNTSTNTYSLHLPSGLPSYPGADLTLNFDGTGKLTQVKDAANRTIGLSYYPQGAMEFPALGGITDSSNAFWDVDRAYVGEERIVDITSPSAQHTVFDYVNGSDDYLDKVTEADGKINRYAYDTSHRLKSVTTPDGNVTRFTYSGTSAKVASVIRTTDTAHTTGPTTTFTYSSPTSPCQSANFDYTKTVVQRPDNASTTYCANDHAQITYDTDNPTEATPSGEWYDLHDRYTQGTGTHNVTLTGADKGAGVKKLSLEADGAAETASATLPCDPRNATNPVACPHRATKSASFDPGSLTEGAHAFRARTTDYAGNSVRSDPWAVIVDRTAPTAPSEIDLDEYDGNYSIGWETSVDPVLADGTPGSGLASYRLRYRINGGTWTEYSTDPDDIVLTGLNVGDTVEIQVTSADAVGNVSATAAKTVTIAPSQPWTASELAEFDADSAWESRSDAYDPDGLDHREPNDDDDDFAGPPPPPSSSLTTAAAGNSCPFLSGVPDYGFRDWECLLDTGTNTGIQEEYDPYYRTQRKVDNLRCRGSLKRAMSRRAVQRNCQQEWTWVYRLITTDHQYVWYVGITNNLTRRCAEHGVPRDRCQPVMRVPNRATALSIEQYLMEVYGFNNTRVHNENFDHNHIFTEGWLNGRDPTLTNNLRRNFSAKYRRALYCAAIRTAVYAIHVYPPQLRGVYPPATKLWWPNFPGRDCIPVDHIQAWFKLFEGRDPVNPR